MTASPHTGPGRETRRRAAVPDGDGVGVGAARRGAEAAVYCVSRVRRGVLLCCDITSTIRRLYDPNSAAYEALRAENSRKMNERWAGEWGVKMRDMMKTPEFREQVSKGASRRSEGIAVLWHLRAMDARRLQERRSWVVSFSILRPFGPTSSLVI